MADGRTPRRVADRRTPPGGRYSTNWKTCLRYGGKEDTYQHAVRSKGAKCKFILGHREHYNIHKDRKKWARKGGPRRTAETTSILRYAT
jgi:hypothetical protein